ncbi:winged helix-turn-helix domain-containing protein [Luedemannella flava]|uniref:Winged helix-turn-helix domain-containing protein n=1 Tax=Luedemannella flava TaxID=349316 RepID=A0ABP4YQ63_9ACTN
MVVHELSRRDARRIAVRAQLLARPRPTELLEVVRELTFLQVDPTAAVAPSADLVIFSRLGASSRFGELAGALARGDLVEHLGRVRPWADMALYRAEMAGWADREDLLDWEEHQREWVDANDACRRDILDRLEIDGPLTSAQLPDTCWVPWRSSGWNNNRNVGRLLEFMVCRGEVAVAGRRGREKLWDLAERVYPDEAVPEDEALRERARRWLRSLGIARATRTENARESAHAATVGEPAVVEGVRGMWRVDPAQLGQPFTGRTALLSPLDRLVFDRPRMADLFEFDYQLEMYKPAAKRRWGYYALPILSGDRLVGKLDATADRRAGALRVTAVHEDAPFDAPTAEAVRHEIENLAAWLGLEPVLPGRAAPPALWRHR